MLNNTHKAMAIQNYIKKKNIIFSNATEKNQMHNDVQLPLNTVQVDTTVWLPLEQKIFNNN